MAAFGLVAVYREVVDPDACLIGAIEAVGTKRVTLRTIDPDAHWDEEREVLALSEITRVDFGGR